MPLQTLQIQVGLILLGHALDASWFSKLGRRSLQPDGEGQMRICFAGELEKRIYVVGGTFCHAVVCVGHSSRWLLLSAMCLVSVAALPLKRRYWCSLDVVVSNVFGVRCGIAFDMAVEPPSAFPNLSQTLFNPLVSVAALRLTWPWSHLVSVAALRLTWPSCHLNLYLFLTKSFGVRRGTAFQTSRTEHHRCVVQAIAPFPPRLSCSGCRWSMVANVCWCSGHWCKPRGRRAHWIVGAMVKF